MSAQPIRLNADTITPPAAAAGDVAGCSPDILTPVEVAELLGVEVKTLADWRRMGGGPPFFKPGGAGQRQGRVRYRRAVLVGWIEDQERASTTAARVAPAAAASTPRLAAPTPPDPEPPPPAPDYSELPESIRRWIPAANAGGGSKPEPRKRRVNR
ncbi:MAG: hypothetical protein AMXMBFR47_13790 [Planctomycetota bacterium]